MRVLIKTVVVTIAASAALAMLLYYVVVIVNWHDREPSELSVRMAQQLEARPAVADAENGYVYAMAFTGGSRERSREPRDPLIATFRKVCMHGATAECADAFVHGDDVHDRWIAADSTLLQRYSQLTAHPGWVEPVSVEASAPLPPFGRIIDGQRLSLLHARRLVSERNYEAARRLLESDLRFWRRVLESADTLITKMVATAALVRHFELGNLVLRDLDPQSAALVMPADWRVPISDGERSMRRCMVREWLFVSTLTKSLNPVFRYEVAKDGDSWGRKVVAVVAAPLFQPQDSINRYAEYYSRVGELLDAPLDRYVETRAATVEFASRTTERTWPPRSLYNLVGSWLMSETLTDYSKYGARVADIEGVRRAALAAVTLRAAKVETGNVAHALEASEWRSPYYGAPFKWSATEPAIRFDGLAEDERGVHLLYY